MKMHKLSFWTAVAAGALIALPLNLRADDNPQPDRPAKREHTGQRKEAAKARLTKLSEELQLTADQKTKVEAAFKEQAETLRGVREAKPEERREKMQTARKAFDGKMKGILTADQYTKWEKIREQRGPRAEHRSGANKKAGAALPDKQ